MTRRIVTTTSPEDRIALARARIYESLAGIMALLFAALVVAFIAGAFWLLTGFVR